jgi:hypothetical protein
MEAVAAIELMGSSSPAKAAANVLPVEGVQAGPNLSITDISRFDHAIYSAQSRLDVVAVQPVGGAEKGVMKGLDQMNTSMRDLDSMHSQLSVGDTSKSLVDIAKLTWHCTLFSVQCQITSTVANRSADGVSQLFKQQS